MRKKNLHIKPGLLISFLVFSCFLSKAQNVTSPYSILGIGDIDDKEYSRYYADGSSSLARRDGTTPNFSNPAALTSIPFKTINFDIAMRGRFSNFRLPNTDTTTGISKDYAVKRVALAFKLTDKIGIAFGLRPYSSANYQYLINQTILNNESFDELISGSGGVNQAFFSIGRTLGKHLSVGLTGAYLFGSLEKTSTYTSTSSLLLNVTHTETTTLYGGSIKGGLQYYSSPDKTWQHQIGLTAEFNTNLSGQYISNYTDNTNPNNVINENVVNNQAFLMPQSYGLGYSAIAHDQFIFSAELNYSHWPYQQVEYQNSFTTSTFRISGGVEYSKKIKVGTKKFEKYFIALGVTGENSYVMVNGNYLKDHSITFGGGYNVNRNISLYGGIEGGIRGALDQQQIRENYTSFLVGIALKDIWLASKKFGKFN
jgi:hypothetical protein